MSDTDDFNYDSVVSDPGAYTGFLENADQSGVTRRRGNSEASNLLTPAGKARATTPPPPATPSAYGYGVNDSMPSLAVSTPNSEKFQIEFEHERQSNVQFGLKSGMYNHGQGAAGATDDFSAQLRADVVVAKAWGTFRTTGSQNGAAQSLHSPGANGGDGVDEGDTTFDALSFSDSSDLTLSRMIRESSVNDTGRQTELEQQYGRGEEAQNAGEESHKAEESPEMDERRRSLATAAASTPKLARSQSDTSPESRVLRSALRGGRSVSGGNEQGADEPTSPTPPTTTPRKVSFAVLQQRQQQEQEQRQSAESAEEHLESTAPLDSRVSALDDEASAESIEFRLSESGGSQISRSVAGGAGLPGDMFRKFAGWAQNSLMQRSPSPKPTALTVPASTDNAVSNSVDSSQSNASVSPVRTEPMRSQVLVTPQSGGARRNVPTPSRSVNPQTPSRSVNPLTRHLALKAIMSAPSLRTDRQLDRPQPVAWPKNLTGAADNTSVFLSSQGDDSLDPYDLSGLQRQIDGLTNMFKQDQSAVQEEVRFFDEVWIGVQEDLRVARQQALDAEAARDLLQRQAEALDVERSEWEAERQRLEDDARELQSSIDRWRQRIGDVESERQGVWKEGSQTRAEILHALALAEDRVLEERAARVEAEAELRSKGGRLEAEAELKSKCDRLESEQRELLDHLESAIATNGQLEAENRGMQAELHDAQMQLHEMQALSGRLEGMAEKNRQLERRLAVTEAERASFAARHGGEATLKEALDGMRGDNALLKETLEDLTEQNRDLKEKQQELAEQNKQLKQAAESNEESKFFITAINNSPPLLPQPNSSAPLVPLQTEKEPEVVVLLKRTHMAEIQQLNRDYERLTEALRAANSENQRIKTEALRVPSRDVEVEQLRENEERLVRALDGAQQNARELAARNGELAAQSDAHAQRAARVETELGDAQLALSEAAVVRGAVAELERALEAAQAENERLRQAAGADAARGPDGGADAKLRTAERIDKAMREQRYLAATLRDALMGNRTLRMELTAILLRRAGRLRELQALQQHRGDGVALSDDGNTSTMSVAINHVPSTSQLMDPAGSAPFLRAMDAHLDEMANLIDASDRTHARSADQRVADAAVQCDDADHVRALRLAVASAKQERDHFRAAQEEAAERVAQLSGQIETLGDDQERMRADASTTARIAQRVARQLAVLNAALARVAPRARVSPDNDDDADDARAAAEDDAMLNATIDRPDLIAADPPSNDDALELLAVAVSEAYVEAKRLRRDVVYTTRERARLMTRLAEAERAKLPSYELSAQWGLNVRTRGLAGEALEASPAASAVAARGDSDQPPPSLLLPDESAVLAELAAMRRGGELLASAEAGGAAGGNDGPDVPPVNSLLSLAARLRRAERQLKTVAQDRDKLEEFNRELVLKLDRAYADCLRAQQESNALSLRSTAAAAASARAAPTTPTRATDWDDFASIKRELDRCARKNKSYFDNVDRLCRVLNRHTIDSALDGNSKSHSKAIASSCNAPLSPATPSSSDARGQQPENLYRTLLLDMADALGAKGDLDDRLSIRDNFANMAAAVRHRMAAKEGQLTHLRSALDTARLASQASPSSSSPSSSHSLSKSPAAEESLRSTKRRVSELETQLTEAHEQLTTQQANVRSLNDNISRLRQQCVASDSDVQEARLERDGWHQQYLACEQTLNYQIEENDRLSDALKRLSQQQRSRTTEEFVVNGRLSYNDNSRSATVDWDRLRVEWSAAVRQEDAEIWRNKEFLLRQTFGSQLEIYRWALKVWGDIVRSIAAQSNTPHRAALSDSADSAAVVGSKRKALQQAVAELESEVEAAVHRAHSLHETLLHPPRRHPTPPSGSKEDEERPSKTNRAYFVESLSQIAQDLGRDFAGSWRDNVRGCIVAVSSCLSSASATLLGQHQPSSSPVLVDSPTSTNSSANSPTFPRISDEQKAMIREHYAKREDKLKRELRAQIQAECAQSKAREDAAKSVFKQERRTLVAECKYLRGRIQIEVDRLASVDYQKNVFLQLLGGQEGVLRRIGVLVYGSQSHSYNVSADDGYCRTRRLWRRVLLAVRLKNRLTEILDKRRAVDAIKSNAIRSLDSSRNPRAPMPRGPPPPPTAPSTNKRLYECQPQYVHHHHYQPQQFIGLRSTPITPSRLRNRSSELRSSTGSSVTH